MKIWRRSAPYGTVAEHGLYFLAFACSPQRFQVQLEKVEPEAAKISKPRVVEARGEAPAEYEFDDES